MSLAKLTSVSTQTLSLLLERQRLQTLPTANNAAATHGLHLPQITKNLGTLRSGILEMEAREGRIESVRLLRGQYERMRTMLNGVVDVDRYAFPPLFSLLVKLGGFFFGGGD